MPRTSALRVKQEPERVPEQAIDLDELRSALGCFATGVVVVTTVGDRGAPVGLTINSFNSVSLDPPLVLWSLANTAPSIGAFRTHGDFAINILAADQIDVCKQFARPALNKFSGVDYRAGYNGVPLIDGSAAQFECRAWATYPGGDHEIHLGEVVGIRTSERPPLLFHRGRFTGLPDFEL
jgi:3-hydroxy-9,10-secoandrosta-1,3,5(10)-triene-9,17-dione monooxygenase reductase component